MAVTLRYFSILGKPAFQPITVSVRIELIDIVVRVRCRREESSRSLSHLLMSFLF